MEAPSEIVVYRARAVHTMDPDASVADAVAVRGDRVIAVGRLDEVLEAVTDGSVRTDDTFADAVLLPGLIDQHLHPLLGATTLATEVIATEDWVLPGRVLPAASSPGEYDERLRAAHSALGDPDEWLLSWGYHGLWHGELDRDRLDAISSSRPIGIWHRSCHEWFMNSAAIDRIGLTSDSIDGLGRVADTIDVERGRAWEVGFFQHVLPLVAPVLLSRERMEFGLHQMVRYLHSNGVTAFNEPGIAWAFEPVDLYREILGAPDCPILSTFMIDGRSLAATGRSPDEAVAAARSQLDRLPPTGKVSLFRDQVKFFADGAIISQLMMMREPYVDRAGQPDLDHHGEWLMEPEVLRAHLSAFWDAGWQVHTHVNGDAGLDVLLDVLEECRRRTPRDDHRSVIVHFANSTEEQIDRIARLGAIVSANPYYPVGFADKYGEFGLGPERADAMVRARSVLDRGIPLSFHSDLPMAPSDPLFLARCAVERRTPSGRIAGPEQRIDVHDALRAVTVEAAWSWRMEDELGSIEPGKRATFTVLDRDPYEPDGLSTATVLGTVYDGKWFPVDRGVDGAVPDAAGAAVTGWAGPVGAGCTCGAARALARAWDGLRAA